MKAVAHDAVPYNVISMIVQPDAARVPTSARNEVGYGDADQV